MQLGRYTSFSHDRQNSLRFPDQINSLTFQVRGNPVLVKCHQNLSTTTTSNIVSHEDSHFHNPYTLPFSCSLKTR